MILNTVLNYTFSGRAPNALPSQRIQPNHNGGHEGWAIAEPTPVGFNKANVDMKNPQWRARCAAGVRSTPHAIDTLSLGYFVSKLFVFYMSKMRPNIRVQKIYEYVGHKAPVFALQEGKEGVFYSASGDGTVVEWNSQTLSDGKALLNYPNQPFYSLHFTDPWLIAGSANGAIFAFNTLTKELHHNFQAHTKAVFDLLLWDNFTLFSAGGDGKLNLWSFPDLKLIHSLECAKNSIRTIAKNPLHPWLAIGASDAYITIYHFQDLQFKTIKKWKAHEPSVFDVIFQSDKSWLISTGRDALIKVWNANSFELIMELPAHIQSIHHLALSPDHQFLLSASMDKLLKLWDLPTLQLLKVIDKNRNDSHTSSINSVIWNTYNQSILTASDDRKIMQWLFDFNPQNYE